MTVHWWLALVRFKKSMCSSCKNMKSKSLGSVLLRRSSCAIKDLLMFFCQKWRGLLSSLCPFMRKWEWVVCRWGGQGAHEVRGLGLSGCLGRSMFLGSGFASYLGDPWGKVAVCEGLLAGFICGWFFPIFLQCGRSGGHLGGRSRVDLWGAIGSQCRHQRLAPKSRGPPFLGRTCSVRQLCVIGIAWPFQDTRGILGPMPRVLPSCSWRSSIGPGRLTCTPWFYGFLHRCHRCRQVSCSLWRSENP